jgi:hypothetical protein
MSTMLAAIARSFWVVLACAAGTAAQVVELAKLVDPLAPGGGDYFGFSVALSADRAILGALNDDGAVRAQGAAHVFERGVDGSWTETAVLRAVDGMPSDSFGWSVALSGERALVAATDALGAAFSSGAAYIFRRDASGRWQQEAKLFALDGHSFDWFGSSVALDGDRALVGAHSHEDGEALNSGAAFIFERAADGTWSQVAELRASDGDASDSFGFSVTLRGERALVSALSGEGAVADSGAAYVFERRSDGHWVEVGKLAADDGGFADYFGTTTALWGSLAVVGAPYHQADGPLTGAVFVFERNATGTWTQTAELDASDGQPGDGFGSFLSMSGERLVVSAPTATDGGVDSGLTYLFERATGGTFVEVAQLVPSDAAPSDYFGRSVALDGDRILSGAYGDDDSGSLSGAAYLFDVRPLSSPTSSVSLSAGGSQPLEIDAGHLHGGESYLVLGSASGTEPGFTLASGIHLPLNLDAYFVHTLRYPNSPPLLDSLGVLSPAGSAQLAFVVPPGSPPALAGLQLDHACVIFAPGLAVQLVTNAVPVLLSP